jgi:D-sedoheptulose 7-phosphate isomerase
MINNEILKNNLKASIEAKHAFLKDVLLNDNFNFIVNEIIKRYKKGGRLYVAGNGGSAADAQHFVAEFVSKLSYERNPLPAEAISTDTSVITSIGNDYGFEFIFSRQLKAKLREFDLFLGITTSGKSKNILNAFDQCKKMNICCIALTGNDVSHLINKADFIINVPSEKTSTIQEVHIVILHSICECVERSLFNII